MQEKSSHNTFDAIVIGSGISGGWAAKELCENGKKTLLLERGRDVRHVRDYPTASMDPWEFPNRGHLPYETFLEDIRIAREAYEKRVALARDFHNKN